MSDLFLLEMKSLIILLLSLAAISLAIGLSAFKLKEAFANKSTKAIWFYTWIILIAFFYFFKYVV